MKTERLAMGREEKPSQIASKLPSDALDLIGSYLSIPEIFNGLALAFEPADTSKKHLALYSATEFLNLGDLTSFSLVSKTCRGFIPTKAVLYAAISKTGDRFNTKKSMEQLYISRWPRRYTSHRRFGHYALPPGTSVNSVITIRMLSMIGVLAPMLVGIVSNQLQRIYPRHGIQNGCVIDTMSNTIKFFTIHAMPFQDCMEESITFGLSIVRLPVRGSGQSLHGRILMGW
jgi:hypothetical protein